MKAMLIINGLKSRQESFETVSRTAGKRARQLRKLGYSVAVSPQGYQVTPWGLIKVSMVTIFNPDALIPEIESY